MAGDFAPLEAWMSKLGNLTSDAAMSRVLRAAGTAGKKSALDAAADSLGGDRRFSHWKGKPALSAGFDISGPTEITVNFRPGGLWKLAESGRHSSGDIYRRGETKSGRGSKGSAKKYGRAVKSFSAGQHAPAIKFSNGDYVAHSRFGPSHGLKTYSQASRKASTTVPKAAHDQWVEEIGKAIH